MTTERTRDQISDDLTTLRDYHAEHPERDPTGTLLLYDIQKLTLEVLLDIREILYRIERDRAPKWGSKL
jgi:hypothetical protein